MAPCFTLGNWRSAAVLSLAALPIWGDLHLALAGRGESVPSCLGKAGWLLKDLAVVVAASGGRQLFRSTCI
eukprot:11116236-Heterocapsa_arctica.AAC.1